MNSFTVWNLLKANRFQEVCDVIDEGLAAGDPLVPIGNKIRALIKLNRLEEAEQMERQVIANVGAHSIAGEIGVRRQLLTVSHPKPPPFAPLRLALATL